MMNKEMAYKNVCQWGAIIAGMMRAGIAMVVDFWAYVVVLALSHHGESVRETATRILAECPQIEQDASEAEVRAATVIDSIQQP